ncbi:MAG: hypothetical protein KC421_26455, partial [Anaerolineales bacterium]|nr:hypothetical protein [Anaerolineales bacterium]
EALAKWRSEAIRAFILSSHYSNPIDFSNEAVEAAFKGWQRMWGAVSLTRERMRTAVSGKPDEKVTAVLAQAKSDFIEKMDDDFNAPAALAVLQELTRQVNTWLNEGDPLTKESLDAIDTLYRELGGDVLGIIPDAAAESSGDADREAGLIRLLIDLRAAARRQKDWATSDQIRDQLKAIGVVLEDRADGTTWKIE